MSASWKMASMVVLPLSLALAGVGCVAQGDEDPADADAASVDEGALLGAAAQEETTGEATQACGGYGGYGGYGRGFGRGFGFRGPYGGGGCGFGNPYYGGCGF